VGAYLRLSPVGGALLFGDEFHSLRQIENSYGYIITHYSTTGAGMVLPLLQRLLGDLFGVNHWTLRAPALIGGIGLLVSIYPLGRSIVGKHAALIATLFVAGNSSLIFYSHFGRAYALVGWWSLLLVWLLYEVLDGKQSPLRLLGVTLLTGFLPYLHFTTTGFVVAVTGVAFVVLLNERRIQEARRLGIAVTAGISLAGFLYLPAAAGLLTFLEEKTRASYEGEFGFLDVAGLIMGSRAGALIMISLLTLALVQWLRRRGWSGLVMIFAALSPILAIIVVRPFGGPYAYARYGMAAVPFLFLILGSAVASLSDTNDEDAVVSSRRMLATVAALVLVVALSLASPTGRGLATGPYANTYASLFSLPAFDAPWPGASLFYETLSLSKEPLRVIEAPGLVSRSRLMYRNLYLQHQKETWLAPFPFELENIPEGPYVSLFESEWREHLDADYLIFHLTPRKEVEAYWSFVYELNRKLGRDSATSAYMERSRRFGWFPKPESVERMKAGLSEALGAPVHRDRWLWVWDLRS
jgi:hypothetical protein